MNEYRLIGRIGATPTGFSVVVVARPTVREHGQFVGYAAARTYGAAIIERARLARELDERIRMRGGHVMRSAVD